MVSMEGSREVEAARKRLAAARAQESSASKMIAAADAMAKAAEKNKQEAQTLFERSQGEVEEAEAFLKEAEKRWKVIEVSDSDGENEKAERCELIDLVVDSDGESEEAGRRNKKRKGAPAAAAVVEPTADTGAGSAGDATGLEEIVVEGAGIPEINGTYRRCRTDGSDALPSFYYDSDCPVYSKGGSWRGREVNFFLYRSPSIYNWWYIRCQAENRKNSLEIFYWNETPGNDLPPKTGWDAIYDETHPAPQLQW